MLRYGTARRDTDEPLNCERTDFAQPADRPCFALPEVPNLVSQRLSNSPTTISRRRSMGSLGLCNGVSYLLAGKLNAESSSHLKFP